MVLNIARLMLKLKVEITNNKVLRLFVMVFLSAYFLDQITKSVVVLTMSVGDFYTITPWLRWRYLTNSGAAFSLGESYTLVYTFVMFAVGGGIFFFIRRITHVLWGLGLALVAAGALGNLTDRLFRFPGWGRGEVVDFISVGDFAVFNVADSAVCCGMLLLCFLVIRGVSSGVVEDYAQQEQSVELEGEEFVQEPKVIVKASKVVAEKPKATAQEPEVVKQDPGGVIVEKPKVTAQELHFGVKKVGESPALNTVANEMGAVPKTINLADVSSNGGLEGKVAVFNDSGGTSIVDSSTLAKNKKGKKGKSKKNNKTLGKGFGAAQKNVVTVNVKLGEEKENVAEKMSVSHKVSDEVDKVLD